MPARKPDQVGSVRFLIVKNDLRAGGPFEHVEVRDHVPHVVPDEARPRTSSHFSGNSREQVPALRQCRDVHDRGSHLLEQVYRRLL